MAGECAAIKDQATCSSYKPVEVDAAKVKAYMTHGLVKLLNLPVKGSACPLPSIPPPWVK